MKNKFKNIFTILGFELDNYFKSKSFVISTIVICVLALAIMFAPRIINAVSGEDSAKENESEGDTGAYGTDDGDTEKFVYYDPEGFLTPDVIAMYFPGDVFESCQNVEELEDKVESEEYAAGFAVNSLYSYDYYIFNKSMSDTNSQTFSELMGMLVKMKYCEENNLDINEFIEIEYAQIEVNETVLGKDSAQNFWYCYVLVILVFMIIIMYGIMIATSVTNEKSNRSVEVLVTSTSAVSILFGKVFAGVLATLFQCVLIALSVLGGYQLNRDEWGGALDMFLNIPSEVIITFAIFGIGGFIFYAFIYGAMGALVSKTEDLNKTAGSVQMVIMIVYFVVLFNLENVDGIIMKVASYLPISSYSAMFARVAMGNVSMPEITISAVILYASVVLMGIIAGKIYRNSTLRYGNPIKLSHALKNLSKQD